MRPVTLQLNKLAVIIIRGFWSEINLTPLLTQLVHDHIPKFLMSRLHLVKLDKNTLVVFLSFNLSLFLFDILHPGFEPLKDWPSTVLIVTRLSRWATKACYVCSLSLDFPILMLMWGSMERKEIECRYRWWLASGCWWQRQLVRPTR